mmetsp:Transcript_13425/g.34121  ORF Transcript_13425/g.34121 Transcript_13425/m.34121 type:complete len:96 (+) Transcript_13425:692-979(+)
MHRGNCKLLLKLNGLKLLSSKPAVIARSIHFWFLEIALYKGTGEIYENVSERKLNTSMLSQFKFRPHGMLRPLMFSSAERSIRRAGDIERSLQEI